MLHILLQITNDIQIGIMAYRKCAQRLKDRWYYIEIEY